MAGLPNNEYMQRLTSAQAGLYHFVASMMPFSPDAIEDVVQNANAALIRRAAEYDAARPFMSWVFSFAKIEVKDFRKRQSRNRLTFGDDALELGELLATKDGTFSDDGKTSLLLRLSLCRSKLPARHNQLLEMFYDKKMCAEEIGRALGKTPHNVASTLAYIRGKLADCMRQLCMISDAEVERRTPDSFRDALADGVAAILPEEKREELLREAAADRSKMRLLMDQFGMDGLLRKFSTPVSTHGTQVSHKWIATVAFGALAAVAGIITFSRNKTEEFVEEVSQNTTTGEVKMNATTVATLSAISLTALANAETFTRAWLYKGVETDGTYNITNMANWSISEKEYISAENHTPAANVRWDFGKNNSAFVNGQTLGVMDGGVFQTDNIIVLGQDGGTWFNGLMTGGEMRVGDTLWVGNSGATHFRMTGGKITTKNLVLKTHAAPVNSLLSIEGGEFYVTSGQTVGYWGTNTVAVVNDGLFHAAAGFGFGCTSSATPANTLPWTSIFATNGGVFKVVGNATAGVTNGVGQVTAADNGKFLVDANLYIGNDAQTDGSSLDVRDGGIVRARGLYQSVGRDAVQYPADFTIATTTTVDNAQLIVKDLADIGRYAAGAEVFVRNGGEFVSSNEFWLGKGAGGKACVTVSNAVVKTHGNTYQGNYGTGKIVLQDGGVWQVGEDHAARFQMANAGGRGERFNEIALEGGEISIGSPNDTSAVNSIFAIGATGAGNFCDGGFVHGYGKIRPYNAHNARTIMSLYSANSLFVANGEGEERDLRVDWMQMANVRHVASPTNGWYAVNKGRVRFPYTKINESLYGGAAFVGSFDNSTAADPYRVNSLCFTNVGPYRVLWGELHAPDRESIPSLPTNEFTTVRSVWRIAALQDAGFWTDDRVYNHYINLPQNSLGVNVRYNAGAFSNAAAGVNEEAITRDHIVKLWHYSPEEGKWNEIGKATDPTSGIIHGEGFTPREKTPEDPYTLGWFCLTVGTAKGTVVMLI